MFKLSDPIIEKPADTEPTNAEIIAEIKKTSKRCLRVARKKGNELDLPKKWPLHVSVKWRGGTSHGYGNLWKGRITIRPNHTVHKTTLCWEYASIRKDPVIGEFHSDDWKLRLAGLVCHEVAHAIQGYLEDKKHGRDWSRREAPLDWKAIVDWKKSHGEGWRRLYAMLRREIVNPYI